MTRKILSSTSSCNFFYVFGPKYRSLYYINIMTFENILGERLFETGFVSKN